MGAVGKALGITIRPAPQAENSSTLEGIARASGFRTRLVTLTPNWWTTDCGPLLAFTKEEKQPVSLLIGKGGKYQIFDPITFTYTPVNKSTAAKLNPLAYTLYRPFPDKKITVWDILQFTFRGHTADFVKILIMGLVTTLFGMLTPQFTGLLIDYAIPDAKRQLLIQMGLGLFAASFGMMIFQLGQSFVILKLQTQVSFDTQAAVWDRLLKLKPGFFRKYSTGDLQNRVSAISQIRNILSGSVLRTIFTSIFSFLNLGLLIIYSFPLALVAMTIALVTIIVTTISGIITRQKMRPLQELSGEVFGLTVQLNPIQLETYSF